MNWCINFSKLTNWLFSVLFCAVARLCDSVLPINPPLCDQAPATWWDTECDKSLLVGTWKYGYESYSEMRSDPALCFLARCGPAPTITTPAVGHAPADVDSADVVNATATNTPTTPATMPAPLV